MKLVWGKNVVFIIVVKNGLFDYLLTRFPLFRGSTELIILNNLRRLKTVKKAGAALIVPEDSAVTVLLML